MLSFKELLLPQPLEKALAAMGQIKPTPIQVQTIPIALTNRDLLSCTQACSGKFIAFCIPLIASLIKSPRRNALILVPTKELAAQIDVVLGELTQNLPELTRTVLTPANAVSIQVKALRLKPRIIIATPGRLVELLRKGATSLSPVGILVLDQADRMFEKELALPLNEVLRFIPKSRQTLLFCEVASPAIAKHASKFLKDPVRITVEEEAASELPQRSVMTSEKRVRLPRSSGATGSRRKGVGSQQVKKANFAKASAAQ